MLETNLAIPCPHRLQWGLLDSTTRNLYFDQLEIESIRILEYREKCGRDIEGTQETKVDYNDLRGDGIHNVRYRWW